MLLDQKKFLEIFLFKLKMCHKVAETIYNINDTFGPGTANEHMVQWCFKKFCTGDKSLEDEEQSGRPLEIDSNQLKVIIKADPLQFSSVSQSCPTLCDPMNHITPGLPVHHQPPSS